MMSPRLTYAPVGHADLHELHALVEDDHVRRYLLDGQLFPISWTAERIEESKELFLRRGVGLWLARAEGELVGFCGFLEMADAHPEPMLVYAVRADFCGRGYATEMAAACIAEARAHGFKEIVADVDEVNAASVRVLGKLGFQRVEVRQGVFGPLLLMQLPARSP
jgi:[ribosomal protein S5]-alanine N-acetyltransferase